MNDLLTCERLCVNYGARRVLHDVSFSVGKGEIVTIIGPNGSGKSTLVKASIGNLSASQGNIRRNETLRIGYVPQKLHLDASLPMTIGSFLRLKTQSDLSTLLERVGLTINLTTPICELSGGQLQRVLLAAALARKPNLLILDEPTQGLDQTGASKFYHLITSLRDETGCAILMVSHDLHVVMRQSTRVICLNGHICCQGNPTSVATAPEYRALFGNGTQGALALYQHHHDHDHDCSESSTVMVSS